MQGQRRFIHGKDRGFERLERGDQFVEFIVFFRIASGRDVGGRGFFRQRRSSAGNRSSPPAELVLLRLAFAAEKNAW